MINKYALLAAFAFCGVIATLGWDNVMLELPGYIAMTSLKDCTFSCNLQLGQGFWSVVAFTALFSAVAVAALIGFALSFERPKSKVR